MIKDFIEKNIIVSDGAMGTYYSELTKDSVNRVEEANLFNRDLITSIHKEYIESGASLIRTNTFAANTICLNISREKLKNIIENACLASKDAKGNKNLFIAGNIGPIPEFEDDGSKLLYNDILDEYKFIIDCFLNCGVNIFNFETFATDKYLKDVFEYIKLKDKDSFIMVQYSISKSGLTRVGISIDQLIQDSFPVDVLGFNCGTGPTHLINNIRDKSLKYPLSLYPNAGYPELVNNRTVFNSDPKYFAKVVLEGVDFGAKIIGGCCGTTPKYIKSINDLLNGNRAETPVVEVKKVETKESIPNSDKKHIIAVELDPPFKPNLDKLLESARELKDIGVDFITVADSPSGRMRLNSISVAARIKRDVNIDVMPHICCRDRNLIALKSDILAAHSEDIRKILVITGDPVPLEERDVVKKVFNCNSVSLMESISGFNKGLVSESPFVIGGALNLNSKNLDIQLKKLEDKVEAGATLFLTQPIYDNRAIEFLSKIKKKPGVKILAGILPLVTYKNAQFLNNEFPGITIPDELIQRFNQNMSREEAQKVGINISIETVNRLKSFVDGFYFITPFFRTSMIREIISKALMNNR